jgi:hypothetical protein
MAAMRRYAVLAGVIVLFLALTGAAHAVNPVVSVTVTGSGTVTSNVGGISCTQVSGPCSASVASGTHVTLTANPSPGATFAWGAGACSGVLTATCDLGNVVADTSASAAFSTVTSRLTVTKDGKGAGTVKSSPAGIDCGSTCSAVFTDPTLVTLTASPNSDSKFTAWSGACFGKPATGPCTVVVTGGEVIVGATFGSTKATLTVIRGGTGRGKVTSGDGSIDCGTKCSATYTDGTQVALTAKADSGSTFAGWAGACTSIVGAVCNVVVTGGSVTVSAVFNLKPGAGGGGADDHVDAHLIGIKFVRSASGQRRVRVELAVDETVSVDLRLSRGDRTIASRHVGTVPEGDRFILLSVPRGASKGPATLTITIHDRAGNKRTLTRTVRLVKQ